jgi:hypothetical protein
VKGNRRSISSESLNQTRSSLAQLSQDLSCPDSPLISAILSQQQSGPPGNEPTQEAGQQFITQPYRDEDVVALTPDMRGHYRELSLGGSVPGRPSTTLRPNADSAHPSSHARAPLSPASSTAAAAITSRGSQDRLDARAPVERTLTNSSVDSRSAGLTSSERLRAENTIPPTRRVDVDEEIDFEDDASIDTMRYGDSYGNLSIV